MDSLSIFRNYAEGEPSRRLYIKNLAKQVTEEVSAGIKQPSFKIPGVFNPVPVFDFGYIPGQLLFQPFFSACAYMPCGK